jgi:hypothetical protein
MVVLNFERQPGLMNRIMILELRYIQAYLCNGLIEEMPKFRHETRILHLYTQRKNTIYSLSCYVNNRCGFAERAGLD